MSSGRSRPSSRRAPGSARASAQVRQDPAGVTGGVAQGVHDRARRRAGRRRPCGPGRRAARPPAGRARPRPRRGTHTTQRWTARQPVRVHRHHGVAADGEQPDRRTAAAAGPAGRPAPRGRRRTARCPGEGPAGWTTVQSPNGHDVHRHQPAARPTPATASARPRVTSIPRPCRAGRHGTVTAATGCPSRSGCPTTRGSLRHGGAQRAGDRLELGLDEVVRVAAGQHAHVQGDAGVVGEALEHVPGQRAGVGAADDGVDLALGLALVHDVGAAGDVDDGHAPAPRRAAPWRRRSGRCRACRRAPRAGRRRGRSRRPRRCGGRRRRRHRRP